MLLLAPPDHSRAFDIYSAAPIGHTGHTVLPYIRRSTGHEARYQSAPDRGISQLRPGRTLVGDNSCPFQGLLELESCTRHESCLIGILNPQQECPTLLPGSTSAPRTVCNVRLPHATSIPYFRARQAGGEAKELENGDTCLAKSMLKRAVRRPPKCKNPVGLGAKRTRTGPTAIMSAFLFYRGRR